MTRSPEGVERPPHPAAPDRRPVSTSSTHAIAQHRRWRRNRRYLWMNTGRLLQRIRTDGLGRPVAEVVRKGVIPSSVQGPSIIPSRFGGHQRRTL